MYEAITGALEEAVAALGVSPSDIVLDDTKDLSHGDISTNIAFLCAKILGISPLECAEKIKGKLPELSGVIAVSVVAPGYINFHIAPTVFGEVLRAAIDQGEEWGEGEVLRNKNIMVEHSQPNPFKPFHIGHLMSNTIGESLVRTLEFQQARVVRANYQGDVGPHVAKAIWGIQKLGVDPKDVFAVGKAYAHGAQAYEADESAKEEINIINRAVYEKNDPVINALYEEGRTASLERFNQLYALLGSSFDRFYFESETAPLGQKVVEDHPDTFPLSEGARVFKGEEHGLHTRVFVTSQGFPTYEAKELGLELLKEQEYPECDELIITTATEQKGVFQVIKKVLEILSPSLGAKLSHIAHGMMLLSTGKMSSRTGDVITGESILSALQEKALERAKESRVSDTTVLAQQIAVAAIKFQILKQSAGKDIVFDEARALSLEGDSGPYMQYTHARCVSILEKATTEGVPIGAGGETTHPIARVISRFPRVMQRAALERAPHHIANYLIDLTGMFNAWYASEQILDGTDAAPQRLAIVCATKHTIANGLYTLGISAPDCM